MMLPPPLPHKRVYFSYLERRNQENEAEEVDENVVEEAKRLKHEADQETDMNNRCRKYLQVIVNNIKFVQTAVGVG